jgi:hypothetical protein
MDDYSALAYRIAGGLADVRGCLILSRDGLILGSFPDDETAVKPAWVKFASLGEPERSFVEFGDQVWVYVRRPAYGAFAVADAGVRPGLVIDQLEQMLLSAEEARSRRETLRVPEATSAPSGKPRTSLHPSSERPEPAPSTVSAAAAPSDTSEPTAAPEPRPWARGDANMLKRSTGAERQPVVTAASSTEAAVPRTGDAPEENGGVDGPSSEALEPEEVTSGSTADPPEKAVTNAADGSDKKPRKKGGKEAEQEGDTHEDTREAKVPSLELDADAVVDPVLLAKEFSGLLQVESGDDEGTP